MEEKGPRLDLILDAVNYCRGLIVDAVEFEHGDDPHWPQLRSRLLRALGDRGLEGRIAEIMQKKGEGAENRDDSDKVFSRQANSPL